MSSLPPGYQSLGQHEGDNTHTPKSRVGKRGHRRVCIVTFLFLSLLGAVAWYALQSNPQAAQNLRGGRNPFSKSSSSAADQSSNSAYEDGHPAAPAAADWEFTSASSSSESSSSSSSSSSTDTASSVSNLEDGDDKPNSEDSEDAVLEDHEVNRNSSSDKDDEEQDNTIGQEELLNQISEDEDGEGAHTQDHSPNDSGTGSLSGVTMPEGYDAYQNGELTKEQVLEMNPNVIVNQDSSYDDGDEHSEAHGTLVDLTPQEEESQVEQEPEDITDLLLLPPMSVPTAAKTTTKELPPEEGGIIEGLPAIEEPPLPIKEKPVDPLDIVINEEDRDFPLDTTNVDGEPIEYTPYSLELADNYPILFVDDEDHVDKQVAFQYRYELSDSFDPETMSISFDASVRIMPGCQVFTDKYEQPDTVMLARRTLKDGIFSLDIAIDESHVADSSYYVVNVNESDKAGMIRFCVHVEYKADMKLMVVHQTEVAIRTTITEKEENGESSWLVHPQGLETLSVSTENLETGEASVSVRSSNPVTEERAPETSPSPFNEPLAYNTEDAPQEPLGPMDSTDEEIDLPSKEEATSKYGSMIKRPTDIAEQEHASDEPGEDQEQNSSSDYSSSNDSVVNHDDHMPDSRVSDEELAAALEDQDSIAYEELESPGDATKAQQAAEQAAMEQEEDERDTSYSSNDNKVAPDSEDSEYQDEEAIAFEDPESGSEDGDEQQVEEEEEEVEESMMESSSKDQNPIDEELEDSSLSASVSQEQDIRMNSGD